MLTFAKTMVLTDGLEISLAHNLFQVFKMQYSPPGPIDIFAVAPETTLSLLSSPLKDESVSVHARPPPD